MNFKTYEHRYAQSIISQSDDFKFEYQEIEEVLLAISDDELKESFIAEKQQKASTKSLASSINNLIKEKLTDIGWHSEVGLFKDAPYNQTNRSRWRLDFAKEHISIEVAFNHQEATAHNIMKPVLASELNHVRKEIQSSIGVIIVATEALKKAGNFDGAIGTFESFQEYFKPYGALIPTPIVLIGLEPPETFFINKKEKEIEELLF